MSDIYNSELISALYNSKSAYEAIKLLDEIEENKSSVFILPVYDAFLKYRNSNFSTEFIRVLGLFENPEVIEIIQKIADDPGSLENYLWVIPILSNLNIIREIDIQKCLTILGKIDSDSQIKGILYFNVDEIIKFLIKANQTEKIIPILFRLIEYKDFDKDVWNILLYHFLRIDTNNALDYLINNLVLFTSQQQILISKQILGWKGPKSQLLREKIIGLGTRASEIINESLKKEHADSNVINKTNIKNDNEKFPNIKVVKQIISLRDEINTLAIGNGLVEIFDSYERIIDQTDGADNKSLLKDLALNLRGCLKSMGKNIPNQKDSDQSVLNKIPITLKPEEYNLSFNKTSLYLTKKGYKVDKSFFGFRDLQEITDKLGAHEEDKKSLISVLKEKKLLDKYNSQEWELIHKEILEMYLSSLLELKKIF